jgi:tripartite-type tricarboxylate transporter receptor subunit TctC
VNLLYVPYRGAAGVLPDLFSSQVQAYSGFMAPTVEHIRAGKQRPVSIHRQSRWL